MRRSLLTLWVFVFTAISTTIDIPIGAVRALAWGPGGHMQIADIAWVGLNAKAKKEMTAILMAGDASFKPNNPNNEFSVRSAFRRAATFPDVIKGKRDTIYEAKIKEENDRWNPKNDARVSPREKEHMKTWHYYDTPIFVGPETPADTVPESNALQALTRCREQLMQIQAKPIKSLQDRRDQAFWVAWIEHIVGDLHQPLHCVESFAVNKQQGDDGGNTFMVTDPETGAQVRLHAFWDSAIDRAKRQERDENNQSSRVDRVTRRWINDIPIGLDHPQARMLDVKQWIQSGVVNAQTTVYKDITPEDEASFDYIGGQLALSKAQAVLAGRRLSNLLNLILGQ